jgi:hypothetical protein
LPLPMSFSATCKAALLLRHFQHCHLTQRKISEKVSNIAQQSADKLGQHLLQCWKNRVAEFIIPPLIFERRFVAGQGLVLDLEILILGAAPIAVMNRSPTGGIHKHFE